MSPLSAWCWTPPDFTHTAAQHQVCEIRQNDPDTRIRLKPCDCPDHGGHSQKVEMG